MANFRVIIVGGGIGGLTLANCLQYANIDFVLLEGREKIGLHVGVGVGLEAPPARILDQLGVFSELEEHSAPLQAMQFRDFNGKIFATADIFKFIQYRTGYGSTFHKRIAVLESIHNHVWDKDKILVSKRVRSIKYEGTQPLVICEDGSKHSGDIVVGCDGVNSIVRREMWRISDSDEQGKVTEADKDFLTAEYRGLYGISRAVKGLDTRVMEIVTGQDESFYYMVSKDGTVLWGLVQKLEKKYHYPNIPKYSDEEARALAETKLKTVIVSDTALLTFGDVWEKMTHCALVAVEEGDLRIWTSRKIICIGDSVHKVAPESGVGTSIVIESAASLANHLKRLKEDSAGKVPETADIESCLARFQASRHPRASEFVKIMRTSIRVFTLATPFLRFIVKYVAPNAGDARSTNTTDRYLAAERIEYLPTPARSIAGTMPFNPTQGIGKYESRKERALFALPILLLAVSTWRTKQDASPVSQLLVVPVYLIWMMEGSRRANALKVIQLTLLFSVLSYSHGITIWANIWFFLHYLSSPIEIFAALDQRLLQMNYARALLPTIILGSILPALTVFIYPKSDISSNIQAMSPFLSLVLIVTYRLAATYVKDTTPYDRFHNVKADLPWIRLAVFTTGFASCALIQSVFLLVFPYLIIRPTQ